MWTLSTFSSFPHLLFLMVVIREPWHYRALFLLPLLFTFPDMHTRTLPKPERRRERMFIFPVCKIDGTHSNCYRVKILFRSQWSQHLPVADMAVCACECVWARACVSNPAEVRVAWASERSILSDGLQRDRMRTSQVSEFAQTDRCTHTATRTLPHDGASDT